MNLTEQLQDVWRRYEEAHDNKLASAREIAEWAVEEGILYPPKTDPLDVLAGQVSRALRQEYDTDEHGRRYRKNHAVRIMKNGVQFTFWGMLEFADHEHMELAFSQRREQIVGDCLQLKVDVDVYNEKNPDREDFQLVLDFTDDVAEREVYQEVYELEVSARAHPLIGAADVAVRRNLQQLANALG